MRQDLVIWSGCALLFCAGAVWGGGQLDIPFFKVANIHDLFEIFSSAATVAAVFLAFAGVNAWREQLGAQNDHALAQRIAVASLKFKDVSRSAFSDAQFSLLQFDDRSESGSEEDLQKYLPGLEERLKKNRDSMADFAGVLQECRAIWGNDFSSKYTSLLVYTTRFFSCVDELCQWARLGPHDNMKKALEFNILRHYGRFEQEGWLIKFSGDLEIFDEWTSDADEEIRLRLIRAN